MENKNISVARARLNLTSQLKRINTRLKEDNYSSDIAKKLCERQEDEIRRDIIIDVLFDLAGA